MKHSIYNLPQQFKKGQAPWNKGKKWSSEMKEKLSKAQIKAWADGSYGEFRERLSLYMKDKMQGKDPWNKGNRGVAGGYWKGKKMSIQHRLNMSKSHRKRNGGVKYSTMRKMEMERIEYKLWREAVFEKDNYTCQFCGIRGGRLQADHIRPWNLFPELRYVIPNGRTLCISCHKTTDTYGSKSRKKKK